MKTLTFIFMFAELFCLSLPFDFPWWIIPIAMVLLTFVSPISHLYSYLVFPLWFISGYFEMTSNDPLVLKALFVSIFAARSCMFIYYRHTPEFNNWGRGVWTTEQRKKFIITVAIIIIAGFSIVAVPDLVRLYTPSNTSKVNKSIFSANSLAKPTNTPNPFSFLAEISKYLPTKAPTSTPAPAEEQRKGMIKPDYSEYEYYCLTGFTYDFDSSFYVVNTYSKKYHRPSCEYARQMSYENMMFWYGPKGNLGIKGYSKCQFCTP